LRALPGEGRDAAIVVSTALGDVTRFEQERAAHPAREADEADLASLADRPHDIMARSLAALYGVTGPVISLCGSGAAAVGAAASLVERGRARVALAVGCEAFSRLAFIGFLAHARPLARPVPSLQPRPHGPAAGGRRGRALIEPYSAAAARGALTMGFVDGVGLASDAHHTFGPARRRRGGVPRDGGGDRARGVTPHDVEYVSAPRHGHPAGRPPWSGLALHKTFGDRARTIPGLVDQGADGPPDGRRGRVEAVAACWRCATGSSPRRGNWVEPDPDCAIDCVPNAVREAPLRRVLVSSSSFGGNHASLLLSAAPPRRDRGEGD